MTIIRLNNMQWIFPLLMIVSAQVPYSCCQGAQETSAVTVYTNCSNYSVGTGRSRCMRLDETLYFADSGIILILHPGVHTIYNTTIISGLSNISIVGSNEVSWDKVVITCIQGHGLSFINVSGLFLSHITISNCGLSGEPLNEIIDILHNYVETVCYLPTFHSRCCIFGTM